MDKYVDLARELKKLLNMKVMVISVLVGALRTVTKMTEKEPGWTGDQKKNQDNLDHSTVEIGLDTSEFWRSKEIYNTILLIAGSQRRDEFISFLLAWL